METPVTTTTRLRDARIKHHDEELGDVELLVQLNVYAHGRRTRIDLYHPAEGPWATLTVNEESVKLEPREFLIKTYSSDVWRSVLASGLFVDTGRRERLGYAEGQVWRLADGVEL
jgi:hypothetical protein